VQDLIASGLHSDLDLLLKLFNLIERIVELHLEIVALEDYRFKVHLLLSDEVLLELLALLLNFLHLLELLPAARGQVGHSTHYFLHQLHGVFEVALAMVGYVLQYVHLLLQVMVLLLEMLTHFDLLC